MITTMADPAMRDFYQLLAREGIDPRSSSEALSRILDPLARQLIAAFGRALPELRKAELSLGYNRPPLLKHIEFELS